MLDRLHHTSWPASEPVTRVSRPKYPRKTLKPRGCELRHIWAKLLASGNTELAMRASTPMAQGLHPMVPCGAMWCHVVPGCYHQDLLRLRTKWGDLPISSPCPPAQTW